MLELCGVNHAFMPLEVIAIVMCNQFIGMEKADINYIRKKVIAAIIALEKILAGLEAKPGKKIIRDLTIAFSRREIIKIEKRIVSCQDLYELDPKTGLFKFIYDQDDLPQLEKVELEEEMGEIELQEELEEELANRLDPEPK
jgi:hypothetical protein